jgi:hypothetical protein
MLIRHQVLLTDWQTEHLKKMAKRNDVSFSEMIRIILCEGLLRAGMIISPEYAKNVDKKKLDNLAKEGTDIKTDPGKRHRIVSELYFEARKMTDHLDKKFDADYKASERL